MSLGSSTLEFSAVKFGGFRTLGSARSNSQIGLLKRASWNPFGLNGDQGTRDIEKCTCLSAFVLRFGSQEQCASWHRLGPVNSDPNWMGLYSELDGPIPRNIRTKD